MRSLISCFQLTNEKIALYLIKIPNYASSPQRTANNVVSLLSISDLMHMPIYSKTIHYYFKIVSVYEDRLLEKQNREIKSDTKSKKKKNEGEREA